MNGIEEHEVFAAAVGMQLDRQKLERIAICNGHGPGDYADCREFFVGDMEHMEKDLIRRFRITEALVERWNKGGICFRLCLYVRDGRLIGGHIFKYNVRPTGYAMSPSQQEIRVADRVLKYLLEEKL